MQIPLTQGIKTDAQVQFVDALMENMIAEPDAVFGKKGYVTNFPGLKLVDDSVEGGYSRGGIYNDRFSQAYRVIGESLYSMKVDGSIDKNLGTIRGSRQVAMPFSFNTQAVITQGKGMYLYSPSSGLKEVTDPDLGSVIDGTWIDGYYFLVDRESPIVTDILAEDSIRQLNYGSAEIDPDPIIGCDKWRNFAVVFGSSTMEFYDNVGGTLFPFQRVESYTIYIGIVGTRAKVKLPNDAGFIVLGGARNEKVSFHFAVNGSSENISTKTVDRIIDSYSEDVLRDVLLEYVRDENQEYIYCHLPDKTLIYDITSSRELGFRQWSVIKTGLHTDSDYRGYWQGINAVKIPRINEYTFGCRHNGNVTAFDRQSPMQLGKQQEHILWSPLALINKADINAIQPQIVNGRNVINRDESVFLSTTEDGISYSKEVNNMFGERGARWDQLLWRRIGYFNNWMGCRIRYVGKTNLTLFNLEYNKDG